MFGLSSNTFGRIVPNMQDVSNLADARDYSGGSSLTIDGCDHRSVNMLAIVECQSSMIVFHPPGEIHAVDFGNEAVCILSIELNSKWYEELRDRSHIVNQPTTLTGFPFLLARRIYGEFRRTDEFSALIIEGLTLELLGETSRALATTHRWPGWLRRTEDLLYSDILARNSIAELADKAGVHPVHLARTFRAKNGCTIGEYKRRLRLEFACKQISSKNLPLGEIAMEAGFSDQSHFARTFRNHFGITPSEYRKLSRQC